LELGVNRTAVIHSPEGCVWTDSTGCRVYENALNVPRERIVSAVGAGDAFCAGVLYGIHEGWDPEESLKIGTGAAAASLLAANTTDGVRSLRDVKELCEAWA
jgi:sugar/nucleoside kinase (ribokinase family)